MFANEPKCSIDFELRSPVSIKTCGSWVYNEDPRTEPLCMSWRLPDGANGVWHPAFPHLGIEASPPPTALFIWIAAGGLVEAHNSMMERGAWRRIMVPRFGWINISDPQWRCSAAKAARFALPRALEDVCRVLKTREQKDMEGHKLMLRLCKPRKPRKAEVAEWTREHGDAPMPLLYHESKAEFERLWEYCHQDTAAEESVSAYLPDLSPLETRIFLADQAINERGVYVCPDAIGAALGIVEELTGGMTAELPRLTCSMMAGLIDEGWSLGEALETVGASFKDGPPDAEVERATQRARVLAWVNGRGVPLLDTQGDTVDILLRRQDMKADVHRVLTILRAVNRTSTAKYVAMRDRVSAWDGRVRGTTIYHGASTGRWTGAGFQPHNLPRGAIYDMEGVWDDLLDGHRRGDLSWVEAIWGDVMETLSHATRGAIAAAPGSRLWVADYAAIESRVLFWLADQQNALDVFRRNEDIYCALAAQIFRNPDIRKETKDQYKDERQLGKQAILGLGYGMGAKKFVDTCAKYGIVITMEFAEEVVSVYRGTYPAVKGMWYAQEEAAIAACRAPGRTFTCGKIKWRVFRAGAEGKGLPFLHCKLPSGRTLAYCDPRIMDRETPWGAMKPCLTFMGVDAYTRQWTRQSTYGGSLVENIVQAAARDLLAEAILRAEDTGVYRVVMHVHDEICAEADCYVNEYGDNCVRGNAEEFEQLMSALPEWAEGCPVEAEAPKVRGEKVAMVRYRK